MYPKKAYWHLQLALLCSLFSLTQCHLDVSTEQQQEASQAVDNVEVTSFNIERDTSPGLTNWMHFDVGQEIICVPSGWKSHVVARKEAPELVLVPPDSMDTNEHITFSRWANDLPSVNNNVFAQKLVTAAFRDFRISGDTLKKLVFKQDFGVERNVNLFRQGKAYKGYCLVYVNDSCTYRFRIILANNRLKNYQGNLLGDIIGNLQIDHKYFLRNDNPLKQVFYLH